MTPALPAALPSMEHNSDPHLIAGRITVPALPTGWVARPELVATLRGLVDSASVVAIIATAGSGKTAAVTELVRTEERPVVWLTCDESDASGGRLITYLEAAVRRVLPNVRAAATAALSDGLPHSEALGMFAESVGREPVILVLDETERLGDDPVAWRILGSFVRYAGPELRVILVGRRNPPAAWPALPPGRQRSIGDAQLAFTVAEARAALELAQAPGVPDVQAIVEATGGWITGVMFEAWRSDENIAGAGGDADPLNGYLSSQILAELTERERGLLVVTSLLDDVTAVRATALGVPDAAATMDLLRLRRLPASWSDGAGTLRCSPRFREYLLHLLERGSEPMTALYEARGRLHLAEHHDEEAVEDFLQAGVAVAAVLPAQRCIGQVLRRGDLDVAERWLGALRTVSPIQADPLTEAELMLAVAREDHSHGIQIVDRLREMGTLETLVRGSELAASLVAWCYLNMARFDDVLELQEMLPGPASDRIRIAASVVINGPYTSAMDEAPAFVVADAFTLIARYALGRVGDLADARVEGWADVVTSPWLLAAQRAVGKTQQALETYERTMEHTPSRVLEIFVGPELLMDAELDDRARECIADGWRAATDSGSLAFKGLNRLSAVRFALRVDHDPAIALRILDDMQRMKVDAFAFVDEAMHAWRGLAYLRQGDPEAAVEVLRLAVAQMAAADRILELPAAAVWLAEAEWCVGQEEAADTATAIAYDAAVRQRSTHLLVQALRDVPDVVARRLDAEADPDSEWFAIARSVRGHGAPVDEGRGFTLHVHDLGPRRLAIDGTDVVRASAKSCELLAHLAATGRREISRAECLDVLFDGRSEASSRNYLRQTLHRLVKALPADALELHGDLIRLAATTRLTSDSTQLERTVAEAGVMRGADRLAALRAALAGYDAGAFLPGARGWWADERDRVLREAAITAREDAAALCIDLGRYEDGRALADDVLAADPLRERAWRTKMRAVHALGDESQLVSTFRACRESLAEVGASPSDGTQRLLATLRR